jgi:hypothetical protein
MRSRSVVTALVTLTAGLAASAVVRRLSSRRPRPAQPASPSAAAEVVPAPIDAASTDAVVLPFSRRTPAETVAVRPAPATRCGDNGGRTKAGAPCGARGTVGGRCHHHRLAA